MNSLVKKQTVSLKNTSAPKYDGDLTRGMLERRSTQDTEYFLLCLIYRQSGG